MGCQHSHEVGGHLQSHDTTANRKHLYTNCCCLGCGCSDDLCRPGVAAEVRCCCLEHASRCDLPTNTEVPDLCAARVGVKVCPVVADVRNPLVDNHELIVVAEKKLLGCEQIKTPNGRQVDCDKIPRGGRIQCDTYPHGKKLFTNVICVGCGISDNLCGPALAAEVQCCCLESATRCEVGKCDEVHEICAGRVGVKVLPLVVDLKNPLVDHEELIVVADKKLLGI